MKLNAEISKFRLATFTPDPSIPLSLSRVCGPLLDMARQDRRLEIVLPPVAGNGHADRSWVWLMGCDALFLEQPYTVEDMQCALMAKRLGLPVWIDYGDDLFSVDRANPCWVAFSDTKGLRENVGHLIELADVVTTATETLRQVYAALDAKQSNTRFVILPECARWLPSDAPRKKIVSWRGLASHSDDLKSVLPALRNVLADPVNQDWALLLFGDPFVAQQAENELADKGVNLAVAPWFNTPWAMMNAWRNAAPFLHIYPLLDTPFNRAKPPAVWLEATAAGAAVIGPNLPEWQVPGIIHYDEGWIASPGKAGFEEVLRREMACWKDGEKHPQAWNAARHIYPGLTVPFVNEIRWGIINAFAGGKEQHDLA